MFSLLVILCIVDYCYCRESDTTRRRNTCRIKASHVHSLISTHSFPHPQHTGHSPQHLNIMWTKAQCNRKYSLGHPHITSTSVQPHQRLIHPPIQMPTLHRSPFSWIPPKTKWISTGPEHTGKYSQELYITSTSAQPHQTLIHQSLVHSTHAGHRSPALHRGRPRSVLHCILQTIPQ